MNTTASTKEWRNQNVLFVRSQLDDSAIPYRPMRVLAHLRRALGKRQRGRASGIRRMAKVCRMDVKTVEQALNWLETNGYVKIDRKHGKAHKYELQIDPSALYVDHRLDGLGLSPAQFRILMHMARLSDEFGEFFISERKFSAVCQMKRDTVHAALKELGDRELYVAYDERKSPMCFLTLDELFQPESTGNGRVTDNATVKMPNGMPEALNGSGPKDLTAMPDSPNGGGPKCTTKDSPRRFSKEDDPTENDPEEDDPASFVNSRGRSAPSLFVTISQIGKLRDTRSEEESPKEQIARLTAKFPEIDVAGVAAGYAAECETNGRSWRNYTFEKRVGKAVDEQMRPASRS